MNLEGDAMGRDGLTLAESMTPAALVLGGVPVLTLLAMTAIRYVASGSI